MGAGQQSRIHCTRLAGNKADLWHLRSHPSVLNLPFRADIPRPNRDNAIDLYLNEDECGDVLDDGNWQNFFTRRPEPMTKEQKREWLSRFGETALASDAFFPFDDCVKACAEAGISCIIQPGGSIRDQDSIDACDKYGIAMVFTGMRHFKH